MFKTEKKNTLVVVQMLTKYFNKMSNRTKVILFILFCFTIIFVKST